MKNTNLISAALLLTCLLGANAFGGPVKKSGAAGPKNEGTELIGTKVCSSDGAALEVYSGYVSFGKPVYHTVEGTIDVVGFIEAVSPGSKKIQIRISGLNFQSIKPPKGTNDFVTTDSRGNYTPMQKSLESHENFKGGGARLTVNGLFWDSLDSWTGC